METVTLTPLAPIAHHESLIERFGDWISGIFSTADKVYNELTDDEKRAAIWGSGLIHIIDQNIDATPTEIKALIQAAFPDLSIDVVHGFLDELRDRVDTLQSEIPLTLEQAIAWAQKYLANYHNTGSTLDIIRGTAANILQTLLSPTTPVQKFISIGLYIFHLLVKPHVASVTSTLTAAPADLPPAPTPPAVDNTATQQTGNTPTANTPDKTPAELADVNPPADNPPATDADMQISNEAAASLAGASDSAPDQPEETPVDAPAPAADISDYHKKNQGEGVDIAPPAAEAAPEPLPEPTSEQPAEVDPATLTPGTDAFQAAVDAEVERRLAQGNV